MADGSRRELERQLRQPGAADRSSIRLNQCQCGEGCGCIGHEHPAPGFAFLAAVFAVKIERVCPPRWTYRVIDLDVMLVRLEPKQTLSHGSLIDGKAGFP